MTSTRDAGRRNSLAMGIRASGVLGTGARRLSLLGGAVALLTVAAANLVTAFARVVNYPVNSAFELAGFAGVWLGVMAAAYTEARRAHIDAGIALNRWMPWKWAQVVFGVLRLTMVSAFLILLLWTGWQQARDSIESHERTLDTLNWAVWPMQIAIPIGALLWILVLLTRQPDPKVYEA